MTNQQPVWNQMNLAPPPFTRIPYKRDEVPKNLLKVVEQSLTSVIGHLGDRMFDDSEDYVLRRMIYRKKNPFRRQKILQGLQRINKCLTSFNNIDLKRILGTLQSDLKSTMTEDSVYLPAKTNLEYVLAVMQGSAALMGQTASYCVYTYSKAHQKLLMGEHTPSMLVLSALTSRIRVLCINKMLKIAECYSILRQLALELKPALVPWLPEDESLPEDLLLWLREQGHTTTLQTTADQKYMHHKEKTSSLLSRMFEETITESSETIAESSENEDDASDRDSENNSNMQRTDPQSSKLQTENRDSEEEDKLPNSFQFSDSSSQLNSTDIGSPICREKETTKTKKKKAVAKNKEEMMKRKKKTDEESDRINHNENGTKKQKFVQTTASENGDQSPDGESDEENMEWHTAHKRPKFKASFELSDHNSLLNSTDIGSPIPREKVPTKKKSKAESVAKKKEGKKKKKDEDYYTKKTINNEENVTKKKEFLETDAKKKNKIDNSTSKGKKVKRKAILVLNISTTNLEDHFTEKITKAEDLQVLSRELESSNKTFTYLGNQIPLTGKQMEFVQRIISKYEVKLSERNPVPKKALMNLVKVLSKSFNKRIQKI